MPTTVFEVRCERCRTSFAPGTKNCVHCGAPLGRGLFGLDPRRSPAEEALGGPEDGAVAPTGGSRLATIIRAAMIGLVLLSAIGRACME